MKNSLQQDIAKSHTIRFYKTIHKLYTKFSKWFLYLFPVIFIPGLILTIMEAPIPEILKTIAAAYATIFIGFAFIGAIAHKMLHHKIQQLANKHHQSFNQILQQLK
jgi:hypothetical protein